MLYEKSSLEPHILRQESIMLFPAAFSEEDSTSER